MPIGPKHTLGGSSPKATRQFTDREGFIETFENALADLDPEAHHVVAYYGMGGIGKSRLRKELQSMLDERDAPVAWATLNFETVKHRTVGEALYWMRSELRRKEGIRFLSFDLAYAVYWQKTHPQAAMKDEEVPFLSEGSLITELVSVTEDLPFVQIVAKLPGLIQKTSTSVQGWWRRRGQEALREIRDMEPAEIADWLPAFWARDLRDHIENADQRVVLFIDTYEALWEGRRTESRFFTADDWVREWVAHLPEVLWVIAGRERLRWGELDDDWNDVLDQHLVGELADADARRFLESCGIRDAAIQDTIITGGEGVPFFLDLAVDTYEKIEQTEDRHPEPADFAGTPREVLDRFLHYLSTEERETLKVLAVARQWDRELFAALIERFQTGYPATALAQLCRFSFVQETDTPDSWALHALMRESLQEHQSDALREEVHQFLFDRYADRPKGLDPKRLRDAHQVALREAFYHGQHVLDPSDFQDWFAEAREPFWEAAQWRSLIPLQERLVDLIEQYSGLESPRVARALYGLARLYRGQGRYEEAEPLFQRALAIREAVLGEDHPVVATTLNNLAGLYQDQGHDEEAEPLHQRALAIREAALGEDHPDVATTLNDLAGLYYAQGRYEEAEPLFQRALAIMEAALGEGHPNTATVRQNAEALQETRGNDGGRATRENDSTAP